MSHFSTDLAQYESILREYSRPFLYITGLIRGLPYERKLLSKEAIIIYPLLLLLRQPDKVKGFALSKDEGESPCASSDEGLFYLPHLAPSPPIHRLILPYLHSVHPHFVHLKFPTPQLRYCTCPWVPQACNLVEKRCESSYPSQRGWPIQVLTAEPPDMSKAQ